MESLSTVYTANVITRNFVNYMQAFIYRYQVDLSSRQLFYTNLIAVHDG